MDATQFTAELDAKLKAIAALGGRVYDGYAPSKIPTDPAGYVLPYVLFFTGITADIGDPDLTGMTDTRVHDWAPQTNCVGPTPGHARSCAELVKAALTNTRIGNHRLHIDADAFRVAVPLKDDQAIPARFYLPLSWRLTTT